MEVTIEKFNPWKDSLISGIFLVVLGIIMIVLQSESLDIILIIAGILCLIMGIFTLYGGMKSKFTPTLVMGAILLVLGIALIVLTELLEDFLMAILALGLIIVGIVISMQSIPHSAAAAFMAAGQSPWVSRSSPSAKLRRAIEVRKMTRTPFSMREVAM